MTNRPLVSVVIPTYNRCELVQEAIDSVLGQMYTPFEIIVVDDGSTDGTQLALARYGDRIAYQWQENSGESSARNRGVSIAQGKYIAFLDSDDLWLPDKLVKQVNILEKLADVGIVYCLAEKIDAQGQPLPGAPIGADTIALAPSFENLLVRNLVGSPSTALVHSDVMRAVGGFDETLRYGEDWDLWLRLSLRTRIMGIAETLAKVRLHTGGQWWFPRKDRIEQVLKDHVRLLQRAVAMREDDSANIHRARDKALAQEYGRAAWAYLAFGMNIEAQRHLETAAHLDPAVWLDADHLARGLIGTAQILAQMSPTDSRAVPRFVDNACANLPLAVAKSLDPSRLKIQCDLEIGYHFHAVGELSLARRHLSRAIRRDPMLIRDRGLVAVLLESVHAHGLVDLVRRRHDWKRIDANG